MRYNRFLPLLAPFCAYLLLEVFYFWPSMLYVSASLGLIIFLFTARQFIRNSTIKEKWWNLIILPALFYLGSIFFSTLLTSKLIIQLIFVIAAIFLHLYFRSAYFLLIKGKEVDSYSIENLSSYGNFLSFYFISSAIFGFQSYLHISVWSLMIVLLTVIGLIVYQVFWANKISLRIGLFYILLYCIVLVELAWSITFLSLSFHILGLILAICYYILIGLARFHLSGRLDAKVIKLYLIFGLSSILIVLFTSRWL